MNKVTDQLANVGFLPCDPAHVVDLAKRYGPEIVADALEEAAQIVRTIPPAPQMSIEEIDSQIAALEKSGFGMSHRAGLLRAARLLRTAQKRRSTP